MKFERTKDGQPLDDIFHWEKNFLCPERDLNPRPPDYWLGTWGRGFKSCSDLKSLNKDICIDADSDTDSESG